MIHKACPIVLHPDGAPLRALYFQHPNAGAQVVKGGLKPGEDPLNAAARELFEETGLRARAGIPLGHSDSIADGERWHFALLRVRAPVRKTWRHKTLDDYGHIYTCYWLALDGPHPFHGRFARAWTFIRNAVAQRP